MPPFKSWTIQDPIKLESPDVVFLFYYFWDIPFFNTPDLEKGQITFYNTLMHETMKKGSDTISKYMLFTHLFLPKCRCCCCRKSTFPLRCEQTCTSPKTTYSRITSTLHPLMTVWNAARTAGVAVQASQWPLWKTCYQTGWPTCATLPVDWNGAEGGLRIACIPMITHAASWGCQQLLSLTHDCLLLYSCADVRRLSYLSVTCMLFTYLFWYCAACGCKSR